MNFIPCVAWVERGKAKSLPEKVKLSTQELKELITETANDLKECEDEDSQEENQTDDTEDICAKYDLENYDEEEETPTVSNLAGLAVHLNNADDPYLNLNDDSDDEDEKDDFQIRPSDNLIAVGHVDEDCATLEVYIYNDAGKHLYVHHDVILPAYPLCIEWLNFDPTDKNPGNYVAIGDMTPVIRIWDLDIVDSLESAYTLGKKVKKSKKKSQQLATADHPGHTDAVLSLAWNKHLHHVLASGSSDKQVLIWDLTTGKPHDRIQSHVDKVQSIAWHPFEAQSLLTGGCDRVVNLWDCRTISQGSKRWVVNGEVEKLLWNHFEPFFFYVSTEEGHVYGFDVRRDDPLFTLACHSKAVTGMVLSSKVPGCLITASADKTLKVWDVLNHRPEFILEKEINVGTVLALSSSPDDPFVIAVGGDNKSHNFRAFSLEESSSLQRFENRQVQSSVSSATEAQAVQETAMDTDMPTEELETLSIEERSRRKKKKS